MKFYSARKFFSVLRHDGGAERVVSADAEAEPTAEETERGNDAGERAPERERRGEGANHHEKQRHAVDALLAEPVVEPTEEELPSERPAQGDAVHRGRDVGRQRARVWLGGVGVVDAVEQLGDERDAEECIDISEEANTRHAGIGTSEISRRCEQRSWNWV